MLLSELEGKEIVNLNDGSKLGTIAQSDLVISPETGEIKALLLPYKGGWGFWSERDYIEISWSAVKKIGNEVIIVDLDDNKGKRYSE